MSKPQAKLGEFDFAGDDHVVPFEVGGLDIRGRSVQLGAELDRILERHAYPEPVARLLAEAMVLTVLLGSSLKFEGKFIVQTRSDGPVDMLVADFATPDGLRGYARYDAARLEEAVAAGRAGPEDLLGKGVLALTIDQGVHMRRYQGIVELDGTSLEDVARVYFRQSEQIPTEVRLGVARLVTPGRDGAGSAWRAGGLLVQFLPESEERQRMPDLPGGDGGEEAGGPQVDDAWQEVLALMATVEPAELVDPTVGTERLLYRLFHEHGVRVFEGHGVVDRCSCSREKIRTILEGFSAEEIAESTRDGEIEVSCEFCSKRYLFDPADFA
ncbi:Hsp33 family molecular chaperone [Aquibium sp. A9E412]|uniref:Hsp33 family molecular chaperone n=1 Tax=Aquibium sp. A9E412 TaxID=2976767 RepID=UPI0025B1A450|nr:Hsp33 family molecular chaperone [Aquibium sp. A9E412]MDN2566694.1 Hsp33 family molecular chaperone [Aquibium sp. A9E412]